MTSDELRFEIEAYADRLRTSGELFVRARRGEITPSAMASYVANLHLLVSHTEIHLRLAHERARDLGRPALAAYFRQKLREESGHDRWAESDLASLARIFDVESDSRGSPSMLGLLAYLREAIRDEPARYLAYILLAEYCTVLLGSEWLALLETHCGIPASSMTVVGHHVELDKEHVAEGLIEIDELVTDDKYLAPMRQTLRKAMEYLDGFWNEISATIPRGLADAVV